MQCWLYDQCGFRINHKDGYRDKHTVRKTTQVNGPDHTDADKNEKQISNYNKHEDLNMPSNL